MASLADYIDLRTAVIEYVKAPQIADVLTRLTLAAEDKLNRHIRHRKQIASDTLTFVDGVAALPADYLEMLHVYDPSGWEMVEQPLAMLKAARSAARFYAIDGSNMLIEGYSGDKDITYYASFPTITGSMTGTNWLLSSYPDVYLFKVAYEAALYLRDSELVLATAQLADKALSEMKVDDDRARYSRAQVRVYGVTP